MININPVLKFDNSNFKNHKYINLNISFFLILLKLKKIYVYFNNTYF